MRINHNKDNIDEIHIGSASGGFNLQRFSQSGVFGMTITTITYLRTTTTNIGK